MSRVVGLSSAHFFNAMKSLMLRVGLPTQMFLLGSRLLGIVQCRLTNPGSSLSLGHAKTRAKNSSVGVLIARTHVCTFSNRTSWRYCAADSAGDTLWRWASSMPVSEVERIA